MYMDYKNIPDHSLHCNDHDILIITGFFLYAGIEVLVKILDCFPEQRVIDIRNGCIDFLPVLFAQRLPDQWKHLAFLKINMLAGDV